ncbi:hypothetical protein C8R44DRAFT_815090 [Mycena epipterygia]|nr:hypothetical protein C8R44DRAFT_815090 [Mycena epipterygia]
MPGEHSDSEEEYTVEELAAMRRGPIRCDHCKKTAAEVGLSKLRICSACSSAPYCSVECQRQNWKKHKIDCKRVTSGELAREAMSMLMGNLGDGKRQGTRTVGQVMQDLGAWAQVHNGEGLPIVAWQALGLLGDIEARKSKVLVLGLCRTASNDPRTYYTLKEVRVVSVAELKRIFKGRSNNPGRILKENEKIRLDDSALGAMLVMSVEQAEDDSRPVLEAMGQISTMTFQPLGVFEVHRTNLERIGQLPEPMWKACLTNVLRGGLFSPTFRTS